MSSYFNTLVNKLNGFIRKYYKNLILKGTILSVSLIFLLFIIITFIEYLSWSNTITRTVIYYSFLAAVFLIVSYYIIIPLSKLIRLGKVLSHKEAALIIGEHFPS